MRFNTKSKRLAIRENMIFQLRRQGFMYNGSADEIVDTWIEKGSDSFPKDGVVWEAIRLAKLNYVWDKKNRSYKK